MGDDQSQNRECNMEGVYSFQKCRGIYTFLNRGYNSSWEMYTVLAKYLNEEIYFLLRGKVHWHLIWSGPINLTCANCKRFALYFLYCYYIKHMHLLNQ